MPSVLAIEPIPDRAAALRAVAQERVPNALTLVTSVDGAIAAMERRVPEVILISPLIPPADEAELIARLRFLPKTLYVQTLITPELAIPNAEKPRRLLSFRRSKLAEADPDEFAKQLTAYIAAVREQRRRGRSTHFKGAERRAAERRFDDAGPAVFVDGTRVQLLDRSATGVQVVAPSLLSAGQLVDVEIREANKPVKSRAVIAWGTFETLPSSRVLCRAGLHFIDERNFALVRATSKPPTATARPGTALIRRTSDQAIERAARVARQDVPWLSAVSLPGGYEADLLNVSSSGMLLETSSKFAPGYAGPVKLRGAKDEVIVPARFVRSEVGAVTARGVRYRAAIAFDRTIDLENLKSASPRRESASAAIAEWLRSVSAELARGGDPDVLRTRFREGLIRLLPARDVEIRREPVAPPAGCDSIYFTIAHEETQRAVLQVTFEPGQAPSALDFHILRAAAALAALLFHSR